MLSADLLAEAYAEKVEITSTTSEMSKMVIENSVVPDRDAVGIPAYPGARLFQSDEASEMTMNGVTVQTLPYLKLLSTDPVEKVVAWYKEQLPSYGHKDVYGMSWVFWKGEGEFDAMDMEQTMTRQNVTISDATVLGFDEDMQGAKSLIQVVYE